jgi:HSP20 family protein
MYFEFHTGRRQSWTPAVDVCERPAEIVVFVEMPGVQRDHVKLSWHENVLTISGEKPQPSGSRSARHLCVERAYGHFRRDISINIPIERAKARAELRDGLMRIYLPKRTSRPEPSEIPIHCPEL